MSGPAVSRDGVRVAFGVPVLNGADHLAETLDSLLDQSYRDFGLLVLDNASTDATPDIVADYAGRDPRVRSRRSPQTVGQVENFRRTFRLAVETFEGIEYFAWGSDEDIWHPLWLESMIRELDADPAAVVAFPLWAAIRDDGSKIPRDQGKEWAHQRWETAGITDPIERSRRIAPGLRVPNVFHGLFRVRAIQRCGALHTVTGPDRLLMNQLAFLGTFNQVPEELWYRRARAVRRLPDQRQRLFANRTPLHRRLPIGVVHAAILFWWSFVRARPRPEASRREALHIVAIYMKHAKLAPFLHTGKRRRRAKRKQGPRPERTPD